MSTQKNNEKGKAAEELAIKYLKNKQYTIKHINWRAGHNEIDIIAEKEDITVFVEVKSKFTDLTGWPEQAVGKAKIKQIQKAAQEYLNTFDPDKIRFDVIAITYWPDMPIEIMHFEDAFF
jgi:putative endonuclease